MGFIPNFDNNKGNNHAAQMGKVGHLVAGAVPNTGIQFEKGIQGHEVFGFDGKKEVQINEGVGKQVPKGKQNTEHCPWGAHRGLIDKRRLVLVQERNSGLSEAFIHRVIEPLGMYTFHVGTKIGIQGTAVLGEEQTQFFAGGVQFKITVGLFEGIQFVTVNP